MARAIERRCLCPPERRVPFSPIIVPNPSNVVQKEIGTPSVAEASCLLAAGEESILLEEKRIFQLCR